MTIREKYHPSIKIVDGYGSKFEPDYLSLQTGNGSVKTCLPQAVLQIRAITVRAHASINKNNFVVEHADILLAGFDKDTIQDKNDTTKF